MLSELTPSPYLFEQLAFALSAGVDGALLTFAPQLGLGEREGFLFVFVLSALIASLAFIFSRRLTVDEMSTSRPAWLEIQG